MPSEPDDAATTKDGWKARQSTPTPRPCGCRTNAAQVHPDCFLLQNLSSGDGVSFGRHSSQVTKCCASLEKAHSVTTGDRIGSSPTRSLTFVLLCGTTLMVSDTLLPSYNCNEPGKPLEATPVLVENNAVSGGQCSDDDVHSTANLPSPTRHKCSAPSTQLTRHRSSASDEALTTLATGPPNLGRKSRRRSPSSLPKRHTTNVASLPPDSIVSGSKQTDEQADACQWCCEYVWKPCPCPTRSTSSNPRQTLINPSRCAVAQSRFAHATAATGSSTGRSANARGRPSSSCRPRTRGACAGLPRR